MLITFKRGALIGLNVSGKKKNLKYILHSRLQKHDKGCGCGQCLSSTLFSCIHTFSSHCAGQHYVIRNSGGLRGISPRVFDFCTGQQGVVCCTLRPLHPLAGQAVEGAQASGRNIHCSRQSRRVRPDYSQDTTLTELHLGQHCVDVRHKRASYCVSCLGPLIILGY